jgi:hypothetical protein
MLNDFRHGIVPDIAGPWTNDTTKIARKATGPAAWSAASRQFVLDLPAVPAASACRVDQPAATDFSFHPATT